MDQLLTVKEAAEFLRKDPETIRRWARSYRRGGPGTKLRGRKVGRTWRFAKADVEELLSRENPDPERIAVSQGIIDAAWRHEAWRNKRAGA